MAVKDKLVTLDDLKEALIRVGMWEDITDQLTWEDATWIPYSASLSSLYDNYQGTYMPLQSERNLENIEQIKIAELPLDKRYRYRIYTWIEERTVYLYDGSGNQSSYPIRNAIHVYDSSKKLVDYFGYTMNRILNNLGTNYTELEYAVPASAYKIFLFNTCLLTGHSLSDFVVERCEF